MGHLLGERAVHEGVRASRLGVSLAGRAAERADRACSVLRRARAVEPGGRRGRGCELCGVTYRAQLRGLQFPRSSGDLRGRAVPLGLRALSARLPEAFCRVGSKRLDLRAVLRLGRRDLRGAVPRLVVRGRVLARALDRAGRSPAPGDVLGAGGCAVRARARRALVRVRAARPIERALLARQPTLDRLEPAAHSGACCAQVLDRSVVHWPRDCARQARVARTRVARRSAPE